MDAVLSVNYLPRVGRHLCNQQDASGKTYLSKACLKGDLEGVALLLPNSNINHCTHKGKSLLYMAAKSKSPAALKVVQILLDQGADANLCTNNKTVSGVLPLHKAAETCNEHAIEIIKALLEAGSNIRAVTGHQDSVLHYAEWGSEISNFLLAKDPGLIHLKNKEGFNACDWQMLHNDREEEKRRIDRQKGKKRYLDPEVNKVILEGRKNTIRNFLDNSLPGTINRRNILGRTILMMASWAGCEKIVDLAIARGAKIDCVDFHGETALHLAAKRDQGSLLTIVKKLIRAGADIHACANNGCTPLDFAPKDSAVYSYLRSLEANVSGEGSWT